MLGRDKLLSKLNSKLFGPGLGIPDEEGNYENEIIEGRMDLSYLVGILYPQGEIDINDNDDLGLEENEQSELESVDADDPLNVTEERMPSSLGFSVCLRKNTKIEVKVSAARYFLYNNEQGTENDKFDEEETTKAKKKSKKLIWKRSPLLQDKKILSIEEISNAQNNLLSGKPDQQYKFLLEKSIKLLPFVRKIDSQKDLVTLSVTNNLFSEDGNKISRTQNTLYQLKFSVSLVEGEILQYPMSKSFLPEQEEERELKLIFSDKRPYAVGHGVSVNWSFDEQKKCNFVEASFMPKANVMRPKFDNLQFNNIKGLVPYKFNKKIFDVNYLCSDDLSKSELIQNLKFLNEYYRGWIEEINSYDIDNIFSPEKERIIKKCLLSHKRIDEGINLLNDDQLFEIFKLSNRAMLISMMNSDLVKNGPYEVDEINKIEKEYLEQNKSRNSKTWRPFQLAFFLQILPSLVDENHEDRDLVDLIWFPTGGGKTEAYLFISAFELIRRRYKYGQKGVGVGVINRYTFRFLSMDQFQRTSIMITALETLRNMIYPDNKKIGEEEFSIGLYVGEAISPNKIARDEYNSRTSEAQLENLYNENLPRDKNTFPISSCPSCGTYLLPEKQIRKFDGTPDDKAYGFKLTGRDFKTYCLNKTCLFHKQLPIYFIDEDVISKKPSFLLGTIDKFASVTWDTNTSHIFASRSRSHYPPSLIIQDELHLISGPLGTIAGLYEAAFEVIMSKSFNQDMPFIRGPKYIASTATIRNAATQIKRMYGKKTAIFPSPGLKDDDSFFTKTDYENDHLSRLYCGIMGQGQSPTVSVSWIISALLQSVYELSVETDVNGKPKLTKKEIDGFWTLLGYHNSKREFGRIVNAIKDEIPARSMIYATDGHEPRGDGNYKEIELKSNSLTPIAQAREMLNKSHSNEEPAFDFAASTNIISVGVDIPRLALMIVNGQPKLTSEYIQATSRVGRGDIGGLVLTSYSLTKSRDRSHYETFKNYHESFYGFVEPTSVTPGSLPALNRALHACVVSVVRHKTKFYDRKKVSKFDKNDPEVIQIINLLKERLKKCYSGSSDITSRIDFKIDEVLNDWDKWAKQEKDLKYSARKADKKPRLLHDFGNKIDNNVGWYTLRSMRFVDKELEIGK